MFKEFVGKLPRNCLSVFDHSVKLALKDLKLEKMHHISEDFKTVKWRLVDERVHQSLNVIFFKYVNDACPYYMKEVSEYPSKYLLVFKTSSGHVLKMSSG